MKTIQFFSQEFKRQVSENIHFLIKFICNILCIIAIQILEIIFFLFKETFSNPIFLPYNPKYRKTYLKN